VVELLERLGCQVEFRDEQTCCGQMHLNSGYRAEALDLTERLRSVFTGAEAIVAPSASCAGHVREHAPELPVYELTEYLTDVLGTEDVGARFPHRVCYHPTCHSLRVLRLGERPLRLLRSVRELELVELADSDQCCGFGGTFAIKNADVSGAMLADKLRAIEQSGAEVVTSADNSCLMHIDGGLRRAGSPVRAVHLAEILAAS
jgi:L-lactate dehydrogenase complex protein LldE